MLTKKNKWPVLLILLFILFLGLLVGASGTVGAHTTNHTIVDSTANASAPITVFQGETVNLSQLTGTNGREPASKVGIVGISGVGDGSFHIDETDSFDFTTVPPGRYDFDRDGRADIIVRRPEINDVMLYRGPVDGGINVTNGIIALSQDRLTVRVKYNFRQSNENMNISVRNPNGLDITQEITSTQSTSADQKVIALDNVSSLETGTFYVTASGTGKFDSANRTVAFTRMNQPTKIRAAKSSVTQGENTAIHITSNAGNRVQVRIPQSHTVEGTTADEVYLNSENISYLTDQPTLEGQQYHTAVVDIESSGHEEIRISTRRFRFNQRASIIATEGTDRGNQPADKANLDITSPEITIEQSPSVVALNESFRVAGTGPPNDKIRAYIWNGSYYVPLYNQRDNPIEVDVGANGSYVFEAVVAQSVNSPGLREIVVTASDKNTGNKVLSSGEYEGILLRAGKRIRAQQGNLSANLSTDRVASNVGDSISISGYTAHQTVRLLIVGPQGNVTNTSGIQITNIKNAEQIKITDGRFQENLGKWNKTGKYRIFVISAQNKVSWEKGSDIKLSDLRRAQAIDAIRTQYNDSSSFFSIKELSVRAEPPKLIINRPKSGERLTGNVTTVHGQSNREPGQDILIELVNDSQIVLRTQTSVNGQNNAWSASLNLSDLSTGTYTLRVSDGVLIDRKTFEIRTMPDSGNEASPTVTPSNKSNSSTSTGASGPGFSFFTVQILLTLCIVVYFAYLAFRSS